MTHPALELRGVGVTRGATAILDAVDWIVDQGERWVVLGPNGSGKTTLLRVASLYLHPSRGDVRVLGESLGRTDVRLLRTRIGLTSQALRDLLRDDLRAIDVVVTARHAALEPWWHSYDDIDRERAVEMLDRFGVSYATDRRLGQLSSGERQRVMLARAFFGEPGLVLLDEPTAGLDLGGREDLIVRLADVVTAGPATILVTHHVEEIPPTFTHCLLLCAGRVHGAGPIAEVLSEEALSDLFGVALRLEQREGRWLAYAR
jgi:iron complex transport system ATP-binding protein